MIGGSINLHLDGASPGDIERCREIIHTLFDHNIFNFRNGRVILHFDHTGMLQQIDHDFTKWRRNKQEIPLRAAYDVTSSVHT